MYGNCLSMSRYPKNKKCRTQVPRLRCAPSSSRKKMHPPINGCRELNVVWKIYLNHVCWRHIPLLIENFVHPLQKYFDILLLPIKNQVHNHMWISDNRMSQMPQDIKASLPIEFKNESSPPMKVLDQGQNTDPSIVSNRHER